MVLMKKRKHWQQYKKYIAPCVCLLLAVGYLISNPDFSVEAVLHFKPQNPAFAALILLLMYAAKSITIFFPLVVLEIAGGHLFPPLIALSINLLGILVILTIPYWIGYAAGMDMIQKLVEKYPRVDELIGKQQKNSFFLCFFLRVINCLPCDIVTLYLGATKTPFWKHLLAGTLGILPGMIPATLIGNNIRNPQSPAFWLSILLIVLLSGLSLVTYSRYRRRLQKRNTSPIPNMPQEE